MTRIAGAHAVITGGSSGIGFATAAMLARRGATVSLLARGVERLEEAASTIRSDGGTVHTAAADVSKRESLEYALGQLVSAAGHCDILITSAGVARPGRFLELDDAVYSQMMDVDYFGTLHAIRAVAPEMVERKRGSIVAISSMAGIFGIYGYTAYSPAKFAVRGLMEALRDEMRPHGVHVGCVFPPDVDTPQLADENRYKPAETAAISGTISALSPELVAAKIVNGIEKKRFAIYADRTSSTLASLGSIAAPVLRRYADHKVDSVRPAGGRMQSFAKGKQ